LVKWKGHADATWEPRAHILNDTNNPELLKEIDDAVRRYQEEVKAPDGDDDDAEAVQQDDSPAPTGRFPRVRRPPMYYSPSMHLTLEAYKTEDDYDDAAMQEAIFSIDELANVVPQTWNNSATGRAPCLAVVREQPTR
jgi:hypothetical protein